MDKKQPLSENGKPIKYILKNITGRDINIGDLRYTIPANKSRDLLSKTAHLNYNTIMKSRESGSIYKRLGKSLIEVDVLITNNLPKKTIADPSIVYFPQRTKSSIIIGVSELSNEVQQEVLNEEDEILKQLEQSYEEDVTPIVVSNKGN
ncbi:MAG: hypothetical protein WC516_08335 [Patescibacteria group bacterium]|jgi:hypothetical protein